MKLMAFFELIDIKNHLDIAIDTDKILSQNISVQPMPARHIQMHRRYLQRFFWKRTIRTPKKINYIQRFHQN
jgi:hypothetical protein